LPLPLTFTRDPPLDVRGLLGGLVVGRLVGRLTVPPLLRGTVGLEDPDVRGMLTRELLPPEIRPMLLVRPLLVRGAVVRPLEPPVIRPMTEPIDWVVRVVVRRWVVLLPLGMVTPEGS